MADARDDAAAFTELYDRYHHRLRGLARHRYGPGDADDIAQEAMLRAYTSFGALDPARDPWPWLAAIMRNVARDRYARPAPLPLADVPVPCADATRGVEERAVVAAALGRLSRADRDVLVLREWHELSFAELSGLLGRSPGSLRLHVFRARRRLADAYAAIGGRAVAVTAWARWPGGGPVAAQVAAAVATVAVIAAGPGASAPDGRPPERPGVAAGPAARGGAPAGPTARGTSPPRPLLPPRVVPPPDPTAAPRRPGAARPPGTANAPAATPRPAARVEAGRVGHDAAARPAGGDAVVCAVTALCAAAR